MSFIGEVNIGEIPLGANNPIRVQSMTTTNTMDTEGTVNQSIRMIKAGSEYVRITAPSKNEAKNLLNIKQELKKNLEEEKQSPKTKEGMIKNKSIDDFMKHQIPWIL